MDKGKEKLGSDEAYRKDHEEEMKKFWKQAESWNKFGERVAAITATDSKEINRLEEEIWFEVWGKKFPTQ